MDDPRERLCALGLLAYQRRLLDSAGGNFSLRTGGLIYMTPRYSGSKRQWHLRPEEIVVVTPEGVQVDGTGELSRESRMHLAIYRSLPQAHAVCHAHPMHVLAFAGLGLPIPPTSEQTDKYGEIPVARAARAHSEDLAEAVLEQLLPTGDALRDRAIACVLPRHGIVVAGRNIDDAYDALERIDLSCATLIAQAALRSVLDGAG